MYPLRVCDHVFEGQLFRYTMTDDHWFINSKYRSTAKGFVVKHVHVLILDIASYCHIVDRLCHFKYHITCKTFTNNNICFVSENIPSFHISNKVQLRMFLQKWV